MGSTNMPHDVRIAALKTKHEVVNLMAPGAGTPWEDRGNLGLFQAFFQTCAMSLKRPSALFQAIRRPETGGDAMWFAVGCGFVWSISVLIHAVIRFYWLRSALAAEAAVLKSKQQAYYEIDMQPYLTFWAVVAFFLPIVVMILAQLASRLYFAMASGQLRGKASPSLVSNLMGYCLGPSVLALVPVLGPVAALGWVAALMIVAGLSRLRLRTKDAAICALIAFFACIGIAIVGFFVGKWVWGLLTQSALRKVEAPKFRQYR